MAHQTTRRHFLLTSAGALAAAALSRPSLLTRRSPNDKLDVAVVGVANRGGANLSHVAGENVVALCDVDGGYLSRAREQFPKAAAFSDFRKMLDRMKSDAVVVSTADHTHAVIGLASMDDGRHLYCEKPLAWSVAEVRSMTELAARKGVVTQMGIQIHANANYRRVVEAIRAGVIGKIQEVHVWVGRAWAGGPTKETVAAAPSSLDYDLWLGPAPRLPYRAGYHPEGWRGFWAFGGGTLSDMACHHMDLPFWALDLGAPVSVAAEGPEVHREWAPPWLIVRYVFPAKSPRGEIPLTWYQGGKRPPQFAEGVLPRWGDGTLFVGKKGMLLTNYDRHVLLPADVFADHVPPAPSIPDSVGHHQEWIDACKGRGRTTCPFDYAGPLSEAALLGNVAYRCGRPLRWDAPSLSAKDAPEAEAFLGREPRKGW